ncbi:MAG: methylated-DNA--[protein]-cysteine S-methyltransferase [Deltaproteobacteria bacterium]|nr:methylated-DNA--[protein]-cysteine S-methyltransferase [Deltaproteobacteria bacterium]
MLTLLTMMKIESPVGELRLVASPTGIAGLYLPVQVAPATVDGRTPLLERAAAQLTAYFAGERQVFDLPLEPRGTAFQRLVWGALGEIPYGTLRSYGDLARRLGRPSASRAVGAANGKNPLSILVPCHRVVGANGSLTGYAGGVAAKSWLLDHERRHAATVEGVAQQRC